MKNKYELLIFDWDGTLYDSIPWIVNCLQQAAADCNLPLPSEPASRAVIGLSLELAMKDLFPEEPQAIIEDLVRAYTRHYHGKPATSEGLFEGVPEMLESLKQAGLRLAVATGKQHDYVPKVLASTGTTHWFDAVRGADDLLSKPDPRMLVELMNEMHVLPENTLMIGDSTLDLRMAANANVAAVGVSCGANTAEELLAFNPLCCLRHTRELLPKLL
jgi:phosphoglycolate phosphatase